MPEQAATQYHYVITLQWFPASGGIASNTQSGVLTVPDGTTRNEVLDYLLPRTRQGAGISDQENSAIAFFSLEPNRLTSVGG